MNETLYAILIIYLVVIVTPGPNFMVVMQSSVAFGWRSGVVTAIGVSVGSSILAAMAITGVISILLSYYAISLGVRLLGISCLLYFSYRLFIQGRCAFFVSGHDLSAVHVSLFFRGLLTNLSNPKAWIFFVTVFSSILNSSATYELKIKCVAMITMCSFLWHIFLAVIFSIRTVRLIFGNNYRYVCYVSSAIIFTFSLLLVRSIYLSNNELF